jgi:hypothetical protein
MEGRGWKAELEKRVGRELVARARLRAESKARATKPLSTIDDPFSDAVLYGQFRKTGFSECKIDVLGRRASSAWIAEVKVEFTMGHMAEALGQSLVYRELLKLDEPDLESVDCSVVFGKLRHGVIEDGPGSHGHELLLEGAKVAGACGVQVYLRSIDGQFFQAARFSEVRAADR